MDPGLVELKAGDVKRTGKAIPSKEIVATPLVGVHSVTKTVCQIGQG